MTNPPTSPDGHVADAVKGNWVDTLAPAATRPYLRLSRADVLAAAGRDEEAKKTYRLVAEDGQAQAAHRKRAEEAIR